MNNYIGQIPDEVDQLAADLEARAGDIESMQAAINAKLGNTTWTGPDRDRFEQDWQSELSQFMADAAKMLRGASNHATGNAQEQRDASGA